jgi:MFS family permease
MALHDDPRLVRRAQIVDIARSVPLGVLLPMESTILLTIAIKEFDSSWWVKWLVSGAAGVGLLVAPWVTSLARSWGRPVMIPSAVLAALAGLALLVGAVGPAWLFVLGAVVSMTVANAGYPLTTVTYSNVFPPAELGRRVGWGMTLKVLVSAGFGLVVGQLLTESLDRWVIVMVIAAAMSLVLAGLDMRMPSERLERVSTSGSAALPHFHLMADDRRLRLTIIAWMLMGFGNLMLLPLRVEYLARPQYGIDASPGKILLLTTVVPSAVRLVSMPVFGILFDRISFFAGRILVNVLFAMYVAAFFTGTSDAALMVGAVVFGVGSAGGDLMWSLWVTKFAPPDRTADYMGLHTFFTGVRAFLAPLLGFAVVGHLSLAWIAMVSAALMIGSSLVLVPEMRLERRARAALR